MGFELSPIVEASRVYVVPDVAVDKLDCCVISPGASDKARALWYVGSRCEATIRCDKASLYVFGRGWSKNKPRFNTHELAIIEKCRSSAKNKVHTTLDSTVFEHEGAIFTLGELLWAEKTTGDDFFFWQGSEKKRILIATEDATFQHYFVSVEIQSEGLTDVAALSCGVFKNTVTEGHVVSVHEHGITPERASFRAVGMSFQGEMISTECLVFYNQIAFTDVDL